MTMTMKMMKMNMNKKIDGKRKLSPTLLLCHSDTPEVHDTNKDMEMGTMLKVIKMCILQLSILNLALRKYLIENCDLFV